MTRLLYNMMTGVLERAHQVFGSLGQDEPQLFLSLASLVLRFCSEQFCQLDRRQPRSKLGYLADGTVQWML